MKGRKNIFENQENLSIIKNFNDEILYNIEIYQQ